MAEILKMNTPEDAKVAVAELVKKAQEEQEQRRFSLENTLNEIKNINPELGGFDEIAALLGLSEESFAIVAPTFLSELEKAYENVNDKLIIAQSMNALGIRVENIREEYIEICKQLDIEMTGIISAQKRDFLKRLIGIMYNAAADIEGIAKRNILIPIEYCKEGAKMPAYAHETDSGMDVYALEDITIAPGETKLIPIGIKVAIPAGYELQVRPKSGRCLKTKLRVANTPGTIDAGYRDEIGIIIDNIEPFIKSAEMGEGGVLYNVEFGSSYTIGAGEKFAQLVLCEVPKALFYEVESVSTIENDGRKGGFGSSGLK
jgi:dUTP pyrophosphatase